MFPELQETNVKTAILAVGHQEVFGTTGTSTSVKGRETLDTDKSLFCAQSAFLREWLRGE